MELYFLFLSQPTGQVVVNDIILTLLPHDSTISLPLGYQEKIFLLQPLINNLFITGIKNTKLVRVGAI